jgi:hypothetical protein
VLCAERWESAESDGDIDARDCTVAYRRRGRKLAAAVVESLPGYGAGLQRIVNDIYDN